MLQLSLALLTLKTKNNLLKRVPNIPVIKWDKEIDVILWCLFYIESVLLGEANFTWVAYKSWFKRPVRSLREFHMLKLVEGANTEFISKTCLPCAVTHKAALLYAHLQLLMFYSAVSICLNIQWIISRASQDAGSHWRGIFQCSIYAACRPRDFHLIKLPYFALVVWKQ